MSKSYNTDAYIINRRNYKDKDKIITLYTKEKGKIDVLARSVRDSKSKNRSNVDLMNLVNAQIIQGRYWNILGQTKIINSYHKFKKDPKYLNNSYIFFETYNKCTEHNDNSELIFQFLKKSIETYNSSASPHIINAFLIKFSLLSGNTSKAFLISNLGNYEYIDIIYKSKYEEIVKLDPLDFNEDYFNKIKNLFEDIYEFNFNTKFIV